MGSCYMLQPHSANWDSAVRKCLDLNSKLVDIKSQQENNFLAKHITDRGFTSSWIGLSDLDVEDVFVWTDGVHANFTSWGGSEPNGGERENCVRLDSNSKWVDNECSGGWRFICEKRG